MKGAICDRCGERWPEDPKHPGYADLHFCRPVSDGGALSDEAIERFMDRITKPTYVWRMARAMLPRYWEGTPTRPSRSADTRRRNALAEIRRELTTLMVDGQSS